jgi:hypothetical protein
MNSRKKQVTGSDAGYSGEDQIAICLHKIAELGGVAQMQELYSAMEAVLNPQGMTLSKQGKSSLRFFVNRVAVQKGYIYRHDKQNPGWRITPQGRRVVESGSPGRGIVRREEPPVETEPEPPVQGREERTEDKGLLAHVERVLSRLPTIDPQHLPGPDSTTLVIEGPPSTLLPAIRSMMDHYFPGEVVLKLTVTRHGWHAVLDAHPKEE